MTLVTRRSVLAAALAATAGPALASNPAPRLASLDWTLAAACLTLGLAPVGVAETRLYDRWVGEPALPSGTVELGLRDAPSLEGLAELQPDLILVNGFSAPLLPRLELIAPTLSVDVYGAGCPLARSEDALRGLGRRFGRDAAAEAAIAGADAAFRRARAALGGTPRAPVLPFTLSDARHMWIYGAGSLFADVLQRIGLASAWPGATGPWGSATADLAALASVPGATLALLDPVPADAEAMLAGSDLWRGLTAGRTVLRLPAVWPFGETSAAVRFAAVLSDAMAVDRPARIGDAR